MVLIDVLLPFELTNGNSGQSKHWAQAHRQRKRFREALGLILRRRVPFNSPVILEITRKLGPGQRMWDEDSIGRGNAKQLIDTLVSRGWFHDDSAKWICRCDYRQDATDREHGPAIRVRVLTPEDGAE